MQRGAVDARGALDGDAVGLPVAPATGRREVDRDVDQVGPGEVTHDGRVGPAQRAQVDVLDVVEVHRDVGHVAGEAHPAAVGADVEDLVDVAAVEQQGVAAGLALERVAAVARVPH